MQKILFLHSSVPQKEIIRESVLDDVQLIESNDLTFDGFTRVGARVGIMWDNMFPKFPFGSMTYLPNFSFFTKEFYDFVSNSGPIHIDLITCSLNTDEFKDDIAKLRVALPSVQIEWSYNKTGGNASAGADWIMESNGQSIRDIYFNSNIGLYDAVLGGASGDFTTLIRSDGKPYACGTNESGQLGDGSSQVSRESILEMLIHPDYPLTDVNAIRTSEGDSVAAVLFEGTTMNYIYTCGNSFDSRLGRTVTIPSDAYYLAPMDLTNVSMDLGEGAKPIYMSYGFNFIVVIFRAADNTTHAYSCGFNTNGQLGSALGDTSTKTILTRMNTTNVTSGFMPVQAACGSTHTAILFKHSDGSARVYVCGSNSFGQLGIVSASDQRILTLMTSIDDHVIPAHPGSRPRFIGTGTQNTVVIFENTITPTDTSIYACGINGFGQLGTNGTIGSNSSTLLEYDLSFVRTAYSASTRPAMAGFGSSHVSILFIDPINVRTPIYSCGNNSSGQYGSGGTTSTEFLSEMKYGFDLSDNIITAVTAGTNYTVISVDHLSDMTYTMYGTGVSQDYQWGGDYNNVLLPTPPTDNYTDVVNIFDTTPITPADVCFNEGTNILCCVDGVDKYVAVQDMRVGFMVRVYSNHGCGCGYEYRKVSRIGKKSMINNPSTGDCMYVMWKNKNDGVTDDLIVTANHAILVDECDICEDERERQGEFDVVEGKFLVMAKNSNRFEKVVGRDIYVYYHMVLEDDDDVDGTRRFGIYANGVLTESVSRLVYDRMCFNGLE